MGNSAKSTALKKRQFLEVFEAKAGNISKACKAINIDRGTYYNWMEKDKKFASAVDDINESLIDWAEDALKKNIQNGKETSLIFFLKTKAKHRGYIEKQEFDYSGELDITIHRIIEDQEPAE
jgi:hypothetical protein